MLGLGLSIGGRGADVAPAAAPTVVSLAYGVGDVLGGGSISITGTEFVDGAAVHFKQSAVTIDSATSVVVGSSTEIES